MLEHPVMRATVSDLQSRSGRGEIGALLTTFVDPGGLADRLGNERHQIVYGRRGTGKTHVLGVLAATRPGVPVALDMARLWDTSRPEDALLPSEIRAAALFQIVLGKVEEALAQEVRRGRGVNVRYGARMELDAFTAAISQRRQVDQRILREDRRSGQTKRIHGVRGELSATPRLGFDIGGEKLSEEGDFTRREGGREIPYLDFDRIDRALVDLMRAAGVERLLLLFDDWMVVPYEIQPDLADCIKRLFLNNKAITVKIATVEHRSDFARALEHGSRIGFELNDDIAANVELDSLFQYWPAPQRTTANLARLLYRHVAVGFAFREEREKAPSSSWRSWFSRPSRDAPVPAEPDPRQIAKLIDEAAGWGDPAAEHLSSAAMREAFAVSTPEEFVERLFSGRGSSFGELVHASHGVVRDFIDVFCTAFLEAAERRESKITQADIHGAAHRGHQERLKNVSPELRQRFRRLVDYLVDCQPDDDRFYLDHDAEDLSVVQRLYDERLIHVTEHDQQLPDVPRQRFNRYAIAYPAYVGFPARGRRQAFDQRARHDPIVAVDLLTGALTDEPVRRDLDADADLDPIG